jgi:hypothetical protein
MAKTIPHVRDQWLMDPQHPAVEVRVDSAAWFQWLEAATSNRFSYALVDHRCGYSVGVMTVRKERKQRGSCYWSAYCRRNGQLQKRYVGRSRQVTQTRLDAVAAAFPPVGVAPRATAAATPEADVPRPGGNARPSPHGPEDDHGHA